MSIVGSDGIGIEGGIEILGSPGIAGSFTDKLGSSKFSDGNPIVGRDGIFGIGIEGGIEILGSPGIEGSFRDKLGSSRFSDGRSNGGMLIDGNEGRGIAGGTEMLGSPGIGGSCTQGTAIMHRSLPAC